MSPPMSTRFGSGSELGLLELLDLLGVEAVVGVLVVDDAVDGGAVEAGRDPATHEAELEDRARAPGQPDRPVVAVAVARRCPEDALRRVPEVGRQLAHEVVLGGDDRECPGRGHDDRDEQEHAPDQLRPEGPGRRSGDDGPRHRRDGTYSAGLRTYPTPRIVWIIGDAAGVDLLAKVGDVELDDVGLAAEVVVPHPVEDLGLGQHPLGVAHEVAEQLELGGGELDLGAGADHLVTVLVHRQVADRRGRSRTRRR